MSTNVGQPDKDMSHTRYSAPDLDWREHSTLICCQCLIPVRIHPYIPEILGCTGCGETIRPYGYEKFFKEK